MGHEDLGRERSALPNATTRSWHTRPGRWLQNLVMWDLGTSAGAGPSERLGEGGGKPGWGS